MLKINWPLAFVIAFVVLIWWMRQGSAGAQPRPVPKPEPPRAYRQPPADRWPRSKHADGHRRESTEPIILDQRADGPAESPDFETVTYEEALRAPFGTYTSEQLKAIADREALNAARAAAAQSARPNPLKDYAPAWRTR